MKFIMKYIGVIFDAIEKIVIERSPIIRYSFKEAHEDAKRIAEMINNNLEDYPSIDQINGVHELDINVRNLTENCFEL